MKKKKIILQHLIQIQDLSDNFDIYAEFYHL